MNSAWKLLIAANVAVFMAGFPLGEQALRDWFGLHGADIWERGRVWELLTYGFLHADVRHLFFNMLGIFFFGSLVEEGIGARRFLLFYLFCVLTGGGVQVGADLLSRSRAPTIGASGGIMGILALAALCEPRRPVYLWGLVQVEMRFLVPAYVLLDVLGMGSRFDGIAHAAHLGGALGGLLYWAVFVRKGGGGIGLGRTRGPTVRLRKPSAGGAGRVRREYSAGPVHCCAVCAKTERDGRDIEFRVCIACGNREFCQEHLAGHDCR